MIVCIKIGTKLKCLKCQKSFKIEQKNLIIESEGEYIICPYCDACIDIQYYHMYGSEVKE